MVLQARNLATLEIVEYVGSSLTPKGAVIAAYAQKEKKDWNTWDYHTKYMHLVHEGKRTFICGNWSVFRDGRLFRE
jgi:hypothetical protein